MLRRNELVSVVKNILHHHQPVFCHKSNYEDMAKKIVEAILAHIR